MMKKTNSKTSKFFGTILGLGNTKAPEFVYNAISYLEHKGLQFDQEKDIPGENSKTKQAATTAATNRFSFLAIQPIKIKIQNIGMETEGLFRTNGEMVEIITMKQQIEEGLAM